MIAPVFKSVSKFILKYWVVLLLAAMLTIGATEALFGTRDRIAPIVIIDTAYLLLPIIIGLLGTFALQGAVVQLAYRDRQGKDINLLGIFKQVLPRLPMLLIVGILSFALILAGLVLLIIPGLVAMVWFSLVVQVAAIEESRGVISIFRRSRDLVKGHFWQVAGIILITIAPFTAADYLNRAILSDSSELYGWANYGINILGRFFTAVISAFVYLELAEKREEPNNQVVTV